MHAYNLRLTVLKNQYFGDINDYRKYGLLRSVIKASNLRLMVAWMLTKDDQTRDGSLISYLDDPHKWSAYDSALYKELCRLLSVRTNRQVKQIEETCLLERTHYFSDEVNDSSSDRNGWFTSLLEQTDAVDIVFLDPDNGLEVKSKPYGKRNSSKFVYWREIESLWSRGKSLLIYQHFIRETRIDFIDRMLGTLSTKTPNSLVEAFSTPHVVFLMALQPEHQRFHEKILATVQQNWAGQIKHWELTKNIPISEVKPTTSSSKV